MNLKKLTVEVEKVSRVYTAKFKIKRNSDWFVLKLQEELGELTQSYLMMKCKTRKKDKTKEKLQQAFHQEVADIFSHVLLLANDHSIDLEKEVKDKWLVWNKRE